MSATLITILIGAIGLIFTAVIALNNFFGLKDRFIRKRSKHQSEAEQKAEAQPDPFLEYLYNTFRNPVILDPRFKALFLRVQFLAGVDQDTDLNLVWEKAADLIDFVKTYEKGAYYAGKLRPLLKTHTMGGSFVGFRDGTTYFPSMPGQPVDYHKRLMENRKQVYELLVELALQQE